MSQFKHKISKSRFVTGIQCEKKLYFDLYRQDLKPPISEDRQEIFETGHSIGSLAQQVFPGGKDATPESFYDFSESIANTKLWIEEGIATIYEASFFYDGTLSALDILHKEKEELWAIEVKSSSSVKEYHLQDASFQYWVMKQSGYPPDKFFLLHIDSSYIKNGELKPTEFFKRVDITSEVKDNFDWVAENLEKLKRIEREKEPTKEIGNHCFSPFYCDYIPHCWKHIPEKNSVFELTNARGKSWQLHENDILHLSEIPEDFPLTKKQQIQIKGVKFNESNLELDPIRDFLTSWTFPLYFFDFETIFPSIPILDHTSPFQQIPFQYSLHILKEPNAEPKHKEFLADPKHFAPESISDPRLELLLRMKKDIGKMGSIVSYNASFEIRILRGLSISYPEHSYWLTSIINRFVDLYVIFREGWYYLPEMGNSASIKSVLPAMFPDFTYENLTIADGGEASYTFLSMVNGNFQGKEKGTRKHLLEYCKLDTWAMVLIWRKLYSLL